MQELWMIMGAFGLFFAWLFFFRMGQSKLCPGCHAPLRAFQSPFSKTRRQWFEGGYLCQNCGCETDTAGEKVIAGRPPRARSIVIGMTLLALTAVPAIGLLVMLLNR